MKNTIRVAMIIQDYHPMLGGAQRQLAALAPLLQAQEIDVRVITRRYAGLAPFENVDNVPVYRLPIPGPKPIAALMFILTALPLINRLKPHIIHAHELLSPTSAAIAAKKLFHLPVVAKVLRGGSLGDLAKLKRKPLGLNRIASARQWVDVFVTISKEIDLELDQVGVPSIRRSFIPNGVDIERFTPLSPINKMSIRESLGLPAAGSIIIYTGRLVAEKRIDDLIRMWPFIRTSCPDATLLLVGTGSEEERLKKMAGDGVIFVGLVEDVATYLRVSDLFVLPSATEGLSNALLEAMACGLPSIATDVGGAPDVIKHKENGWLIPAEDLSLIPDAILTMLGDANSRSQMGIKAREQIVQNYSLQSTARRLRELYLRCITKDIL